MGSVIDRIDLTSEGITTFSTGLVNDGHGTLDRIDLTSEGITTSGVAGHPHHEPGTTELT